MWVETFAGLRMGRFEKLLRASEAPGNRVPDAYHAALAIAGRHGAGANGYVSSPGKSASISRRRLGRLLVRIPHTTSWSMSAYPWINRLRNAMIRLWSLIRGVEPDPV